VASSIMPYVPFTHEACGSFRRWRGLMRAAEVKLLHPEFHHVIQQYFTPD
jgi:hypothetical protein